MTKTTKRIVTNLESKQALAFPFIPVLNFFYLLGMFLFSTIKLSYYILALFIAFSAATLAHYVLPPVLALWYIAPLAMGLMLYFKGKFSTYEKRPPKNRLIPAAVLVILSVISAIIALLAPLFNLQIKEDTVQMTQALLDRDNDIWASMLHTHHQAEIRDLSLFLAALEKDGVHPEGEIGKVKITSYSSSDSTNSAGRQKQTTACFKIEIGKSAFSVTVWYLKDSAGEGFINYRIEQAEIP